MKVLSLLIMSIILLTMNFLVRKALLRLKTRTGLFEYINRFLPVLELLVWTFFIIWVSDTLFSNSNYHNYVNFLIITLAFILISWFFIKDYISGVQIKSRYNLKPGQGFKSKQVTGLVKKTGLLLLEITARNGSDFKIPYSQIDQKSIELNFKEKTKGEHTFTVALDKNLDETATIQKISELIINSPWSSYKTRPVIKPENGDNGTKIYQISCTTVDKNSSKRLKALIQQEFTR